MRKMCPTSKLNVHWDRLPFKIKWKKKKMMKFRPMRSKSMQFDLIYKDNKWKKLKQQQRHQQTYNFLFQLCAELLFIAFCNFHTRKRDHIAAPFIWCTYPINANQVWDSFQQNIKYTPMHESKNEIQNAWAWSYEEKRKHKE